VIPILLLESAKEILKKDPIHEMPFLKTDVSIVMATTLLKKSKLEESLDIISNVLDESSKSQSVDFKQRESSLKDIRGLISRKKSNMDLALEYFQWKL